jgi:hypothetical protein
MIPGNLTTPLLAPILILSLWATFEILNFLKVRKDRDRKTGAVWTLTGWVLRPWSAFACVNLVYQLNPGRGMDAVDTAPRFDSWIYPFFIHPWRGDEGLAEAVRRIVSTPTVYLWGAVVALLAVLLYLFIRRVLSDRPLSGKNTLVLLVGLYLLTGMLHLSVASLPDGPWDSPERKGSLLSSWHAHATMLYSVPHVKSRDHFLRHYDVIQPRLRFTIHAYSHPPGGVLSMYYIGKAMGAGGRDIRLDSTRLRYAFGMTFFAALNIFVLFGLGRSIFGGSRHGFAAALLWGTAPAIIAYATYAQDGVYAVFFNLALLLTWRTGTGERPRYAEMAALGLVFSCLNFLNYSWGLATTVFAVFLIYRAIADRWSILTLALRGVVPLGIMTAVSGSVLLYYRLDYLETYRVASSYVREWYQYETIYQHVIAWVGGQIDILLMMGAVTCSAFISALFSRARDRDKSAPVVFLAIILVVYVLPVLFGPTCLRLETARVWMWVPSVPICFAANHLLEQRRPRLFLTVAVLFSLGSYALMRLFLNFA